MAAFKSGLRSGPFNNNLTRRPAKTFQDIKERAEGFILEEENDLSKRERDSYLAIQPSKTASKADGQQPKQLTSNQSNNRPAGGVAKKEHDLI